jgi:hypothetical protein
MVERVREDLLAKLRARTAAKGIKTDSDLDRFPVGVVCEDAVPFIGTVHIPGKRVMTRAESDRRFKTAKF